MKAKPFSPWQLVREAVKSSGPRLWKMFALVFLISIASMVLAFLPPLLLRQIIDNYLRAGILAGLWRIAILYLVAYFLSSCLEFLQTFLTTYIGQHMLYDMRLRLVTHLSKLSIQFYNKTPAGDLISRITSDVDAIDKLFSAGLINAFTHLFEVFGVLAAMYVISPILSLVSLAVVPIIYWITSYFRRNMYQAQMLIRKSVSRINVYLQEIFSGMRIIKSFGQEDLYIERFQDPLENSLNVSHQAAFYVSAFPCVLQIVRAMIIALVIWLGARTSIGDTLAISVGSLAAMVDLLGRLLSPIESLSNQMQIIQQAIAGLERVAELLSVEPEEKGAMETIAAQINKNNDLPSIELHDVRFGYDHGNEVLQGISMTIPKGQKIALVGRTGAGKTTIMNLIAGLYAPWQGRIAIKGINPHDLDPNDRRKLIGIVPQQVVVFEGSIKDNITLNSDDIALDDVIAAAQMVGLDAYIQKLPDGYDTILGALGVNLSFGQSQLLSIARAIVCNPPVLLLDEPTSQMDTITEEIVFNALRQASVDRTILTISHRLSGIIDADKVFIIANGEIVQSGRPDELASERGWYQVFKQLEDLGWQMS